MRVLARLATHRGNTPGAVRITQQIGAVNSAVREVTIGVDAIGAVGLAVGMIVAFGLANSHPAR